MGFGLVAVANAQEFSNVPLAIGAVVVTALGAVAYLTVTMTGIRARTAHRMERRSSPGA